MRPTLLATIAVGVGWSAPALAPIWPPVAAALRVPLRLPATPGAVALTFDDGPHPRGTPAVLDVLAAHHATATFFVVGEQVRRAPALAREIVAAGHALALHGDRHRNLLRLPPATFKTDLDRAAETVADVCGLHPTLYRPPYGILSAGARVELARRGWTPVLWSRWGRDWSARATPASVAARASAGIQPGDIVLLHDADDYSAPGSWKITAAALPTILNAIEAAGLTTFPLRADISGNGVSAPASAGNSAPEFPPYQERQYE